MKSLKRWYQESRAEWLDFGWMAYDCDPTFGRDWFIWYVTKQEYYHIKHLLLCLVCYYMGHSMEDAGSFANGETGQDHMECKRCGFTFDHIYY